VAGEWLNFNCHDAAGPPLPTSLLALSSPGASPEERGWARGAEQRIGSRGAEGAFGARNWSRENVQRALKTFGARD
jgi:hypothetical protein